MPGNIEPSFVCAVPSNVYNCVVDIVQADEQAKSWPGPLQTGSIQQLWYTALEITTLAKGSAQA